MRISKETIGYCKHFHPDRGSTWGKCDLADNYNQDFIDEEYEAGMTACEDFETLEEKGHE